MLHLSELQQKFRCVQMNCPTNNSWFRKLYFLPWTWFALSQLPAHIPRQQCKVSMCFWRTWNFEVFQTQSNSKLAVKLREMFVNDLRHVLGTDCFSEGNFWSIAGIFVNFSSWEQVKSDWLKFEAQILPGEDIGLAHYQHAYKCSVRLRKLSLIWCSNILVWRNIHEGCGHHENFLKMPFLTTVQLVVTWDSSTISAQWDSFVTWVIQDCCHLAETHGISLCEVPWGQVPSGSVV